MGLLLLIVLMLFLVGGPHGFGYHSYGYEPSGLVGMLVIVLLVLLLIERFWGGVMNKISPVGNTANFIGCPHGFFHSLLPVCA
jgi:hypothetical protein